MKYYVMANLQLETPAKRDQLVAAIKDELVGKPIWGKAILSEGTDLEGIPISSVEVRFDRKEDMEELLAFITERMEYIPVIKGQISKHPCSHDLAPDHQSCIDLEIYSK